MKRKLWTGALLLAALACLLLAVCLPAGPEPSGPPKVRAGRWTGQIDAVQQFFSEAGVWWEGEVWLEEQLEFGAEVAEQVDRLYEEQRTTTGTTSGSPTASDGRSAL